MPALLSVILLCIQISAQGIYYPEDFETSSYTLSSSQKGVATSTDIITLAMPVATLAGVLISQDREGLQQGAYTAAATAGVTLLLKYTVYEQRPNYKNFHSFPSGHTATSFATAAFLQRRYGWKFGAPAYAMATYVAWGRVYSKNHHWWDVVAGAAIGAGSAYIFTRPWARKHDLQVGAWSIGTHTGLAASFKF
ncbi:MAG: phosphatase PAP2 family protein [Muribaculaceae bacterium]|nr:phosphatase PAP2 family protein [Muribaculaceae bacterium]